MQPSALGSCPASGRYTASIEVRTPFCAGGGSLAVRQFLVWVLVSLVKTQLCFDCILAHPLAVPNEPDAASRDASSVNQRFFRLFFFFKYK